MGNTVHYQIPYPELNMAPDGPSQMRGLAEKVDLSLWNEIAGLKTADTNITNAYKAADTAINNSLTALTSRVTTLEGKTNDTGSVALAVSFASGWAAGAYACSGRRFGPVVMVSLYVKRTGSAITASSNGNISDTLMLTITSATYQPMYTNYALIHNQTGTGSPWEGWLGTSGTWQVVAATRAGAVISTNDEIRGTYTFLA